MYGIKRLAAEGRPTVPFLAILAAGVLGALFLRRQRRIPRPLLDLTMFRTARIRVALAANALSFFVLYGTQLAIVQYLQIVLGLSPLRAGLWTLPSVVAFLVASLGGPLLVRWFPAGRVVAVAAAVLAAGHAIMACSPYGGGLPTLVTGMVVAGLGLAPVYTLTTDLVVSSVRAERAGMASAVTETGAELGGAVGIAVLGSVVVAAGRAGMSGGTLMDAAAVGGDTFRQAVTAYGGAFALVSLIAAALVAVAAVLAWRVLRPTSSVVKRGAPGPSDMVAHARDAHPLASARSCR